MENLRKMFMAMAQDLSLIHIFAGEDHGEGVKAGDIAPHLKPVHQKDGDGAAVPADLGEEDLLKIVGFLHGEHSFFL